MRKSPCRRIGERFFEEYGDVRPYCKHGPMVKHGSAWKCGERERERQRERYYEKYANDPEWMERKRERDRDYKSVGNRGWVLKRQRVLAAQRERITNQLEVLRGYEQP